MKGWLVDTNVIAELASPKGDARVKDWAAAQEEATLFISVLALAEYDKGLENLDPGDTRRAPVAALRDGIAARFAGRILGIADSAARRWGCISGRVKRETGHAPSVIDTMLAATALEYGLYLATRNVKDVARSGAMAFNPWTDEASRFAVVPGRFGIAAGR